MGGLIAWFSSGSRPLEMPTTMPFVYDSTEDREVWSYADRDPQRQGGDPHRRALETVLRRIEEFLYDDRSDNHRDLLFLAWAIAEADLTKNGSGHLHTIVVGDGYDRDLFLASPFADDASGTIISGKNKDTRLTADDAARSLTDEKSTKAAAAKKADPKAKDGQAADGKDA